MLNSKDSCRCVFLCLVVAGVMASPTSARAGMVGILVPAYFYPTTGGMKDEWTQLIDEASKVPITAIFNPNSGPSSFDQNYFNAMTSLENAGGHVIAYLHSDFGSNSPANIEADIQTYLNQYGSLINGFLIDQMNVTSSNLSDYQQIYRDIKHLSASYTVIGNPGQPFLNVASADDYLSTADVLNIFEGSSTAFDAYPDGLAKPYWFLSYPSNRFSNIVYDAGDSSTMHADVINAAQLNAGYVYVTDQLGPTPSNPNANPYDQLPSYWNDEVAAVQDILSVPEPSTLSYLASVALCCPLTAAARVRIRRRSRA